MKICEEWLKGWGLESWRSFPFEYEELSTCEITVPAQGGEGLAQIADSWIGGKKSGDVQPSRLPTDNKLRITDFYLTGGGTEKGSNRIFCSSAVPQNRLGPFPVILVFHGGGGHASAEFAEASARDNPGFAVVTVDYNGQFFPSSGPVTKWVSVTQEMKSPVLDLIRDSFNFPLYHYVQAARRVLDWVQEQSWANPEKFGTLGFSYGGWVSLILAGVDDRIGCVATVVSAGGTEGSKSFVGRPQFWEPSGQRAIWLAHADPIAYAQATRAPVFMRLAANDHFFWLSGAARHLDMLGNRAAWLVAPNSDHGFGGPNLPNSEKQWFRSVLTGGISFPTFGAGKFSKDGKTAEIRVASERPIKTVYAAWSAGNPVSPARYWRWTEAERIDDIWIAVLPDGHEALGGIIYFTAIDADDRAASSSLIEKSGKTDVMLWKDGALWDTAAGSSAWRPAFILGGSVCFESQGETRVKIMPEISGKAVAAISNSLSIPEVVGISHRGIKIELGGNGLIVQARVILACDYSATDNRLFAVDVAIPKEPAIIDLAWNRFKPYGAETTTEESLFPANGLIIQCDECPETGITVGAAFWLN